MRLQHRRCKHIPLDNDEDNGDKMELSSLSGEFVSLIKTAFDQSGSTKSWRQEWSDDIKYGRSNISSAMLLYHLSYLTTLEWEGLFYDNSATPAPRDYREPIFEIVSMIVRNPSLGKLRHLKHINLQQGPRFDDEDVESPDWEIPLYFFMACLRLPAWTVKARHRQHRQSRKHYVRLSRVFNDILPYLWLHILILSLAECRILLALVILNDEVYGLCNDKLCP